MALLDHWYRLTGRTRAPLLNIAADQGSGPTAVLVHGIASTAATFGEVLPLVTDRRVISIELLGFGQSPAGTDYTPAEHVAALRRTIKAAKPKKPYTLVGHSLGSLLSARYALEHWRELDRLILVGPPVYLPEEAIENPIQRFTTGLYRQAYEFMMENQSFTLAGAGQISKLFPPGVFEITEDNWDAFRHSLTNCIVQQTLVEDVRWLAAKGLPIEVIYGSQDEFLPFGAIDALEAIEGVTVQRISWARHQIGKRLARALVARLQGGDIDPDDPADRHEGDRAETEDTRA